jgi:pimeloyl-ACP methyl ester carboxylesterase
MASCARISRCSTYINDKPYRGADRRMKRPSTAVFIMAISGLFITLLFLGGISADELDSFAYGQEVAHGMPLSAAGPSEHVVEFQEGLNGYSGVEDTYISMYAPNLPLPTDPQIRVGDKQRYAGMVKFNLAPIPTQASVIDAKLELYAGGWSGSVLPVGVHYITRTNVVSEMTWYKASDAEEWGLAGCNDTTTDRREQPEDSKNITTVFAWYQWNVTEVMQGWVDGSLPNNGLLLRGGSAHNPNSVNFASSEAGLTDRPKLVVRYWGPDPIYTATPTPTNTPTNTPTDTPTPTSTNTPTRTPTNTSTPTSTPTPTRTHTPTPLPTNTSPPTNTPTSTATPSPSLTPTQVVTSTVLEINIPSAYGPETNRALLRLPPDYRHDQPGPLVVGLHPWGGWAEQGLAAFYADTVTKHGWLLLAPHAAPYKYAPLLPLQYRTMEMINHVAQTYAVDPSRIYLVGVSGGGLRAAVMAQKYPDVFAAAVEIQGPTDLKRWYFEDCTDAHVHSGPLQREIGAPDGTALGGFQYERYGAIHMACNLKHVPIAVLHNTGHDWFAECDIVPLHHAEDLANAINACSPDNPVVPPLRYYTFPGSHYDHPDDFPLIEFLSQHQLNTDYQHITIRSDESKCYYWLCIDQDVPTYGERWTEVDAQYDSVSSTITATVIDTKRATLQFNLTRMGCKRETRYVVEERDLQTGGFRLYYAQPVEGLLAVSTINGSEHSLHIYPEADGKRVEILKQSIDTYLDFYREHDRDYYHRAPLLGIRKEGVHSPLIKFDLTGIPQEARILSAAVRLYVYRVRGEPPENLPVYAYRVNKEWVDREASWDQAQNGEGWAQPGCNGIPGDRDEEASGTHVIEGTDTWSSFDVTTASQGWLDDPESNQGVIVKCDSYLGWGWYELASAEHENASWHPELVVVYEHLTPTPTPTTTASPTRTPAWTLTPTASPTLGETPTAPPTLTGYRVHLPVVLKPGG